MEKTVHDKRYEDILLQALPAEYKSVRNTSYEKRGFRLVGIRHMIRTIFADSLSRPFHSKPVADHGIAL